MSCPRCGKENPPEIRFCLGCGTDLQGRGAPPLLGGAPPPLGGGPPRVGAPAAPPALGGARPAAGGPLGPPPIVSGNAPPPLSASGPSPLGGNAAPPPLAPLGGLGAPPLGVASLAGSPLGGPPLSGFGAPPILRPPSLPGVGPLPGAAPPAVAPPPLASNANPLAPVPQPMSAGGAGMPGPILGPMPPLPTAAPPVAAAPVAPPPAVPAMPPLGAFGPAQPLAPVAPLAPMSPLAEPPNNPSPLLGAMPPLPAAPPPAAPYASVAPINNDPFANVAPVNNDPFANVAPVDPYAPMPSATYPSAQPMGGDPFAGAGTQNPFHRPAAPQRVPTALPQMNPPQVPAMQPRGRAGTALGGAWQDPLAPALEQPTETRARMMGRAKLLVTQLDGTEQGEVALVEGENLVGREVGGIFAEDNLLSSRHATVIVQGNSAWVRDEGSRNGVYVRIPRQTPVELRDGDQFCFGRIILRFEQRAPGMTGDFIGVLSLVVGRDVDRSMFPCGVPPQGITIGRTRADLRFPSDGWVSGTHCQISVMGSQVMLMDVGSSNGTFVRIRGTRPLQHADALLMGQRIFHMQLQ